MRIARTGEAYDRRNRLHYNFLDTRYPLFPNVRMSSEAMYRGYLMKKVNYHDKLVHKLLRDLPENAVFFGATEGQVKVLKEAQQLSKKGYIDQDWEKAANYMRRSGDVLAPPGSVKGPVEYERWLKGKVDARDKQVVERLMQFHPKNARLTRVYAERYDLDGALGWEDALKVYGSVTKTTKEEHRVGDVLEIKHARVQDGLNKVPLPMRAVAEKLFAGLNREVVAEALGKVDRYKAGPRGYAGDIEIPLGQYGPQGGMRMAKDGKIVVGGSGRKVTLRDLLFGGVSQGPAYVAMLTDNRHWLLKNANKNPEFHRLVEELDRLTATDALGRYKNPAAMAKIAPYQESGGIRSPRDLQPYYHDYGQAPRENFVMRWRDSNYTEGFATSDPWQWQERAQSQERVAFYSEAMFDTHIANMGGLSRHQHYASRRGERRAYNDPYVKEALRMQRESKEDRDFLETVMYNPYSGQNFANRDENGAPIATLRERQGLSLGRGVNTKLLPKGFYARSAWVRGKSGKWIDLSTNDLIRAAMERNLLKWKDYLDEWKRIDEGWSLIFGKGKDWERFAHTGLEEMFEEWRARSFTAPEGGGGLKHVAYGWEDHSDEGSPDEPGFHGDWDPMENDPRELRTGSLKGGPGFLEQIVNAKSREHLEDIPAKMKDKGLNFESDHPAMTSLREEWKMRWNALAQGPAAE